MAKKKREKKPREVTKRQLSRWQQQQKREQLIRYIGISIIAAVLCFVGAGLYITEYHPRYQTVIKVNDARFNMKYYINMLKYYGKGQSSATLSVLARQVERIIEQNELVRQGAAELGITVSDDEVNKGLENRNPTLSEDYRDVVRTELLVEKLKNGYFENKVPTSAEQVHLQATFLESESQALEVTKKLAAGEDFSNLAAELSLDSVTKEKKGELDWHPEDITSQLLDSPVPADYALSAEIGVLSQPLPDEEKMKGVGYWLVKVLERKEGSDEVHIQVMLLGSVAQANEAKARLGAGEDFGEVAAELSQMDKAKENHGDVGWASQGTISPALDNFVFDPEVKPGTVSEVIRDDQTLTTGGYWLVKVLEKEANRKIEDDDRMLLKSKALSEWVTSLWDNPDNKVESFLDSGKLTWAVDKVMGAKK